MSYSFLNPFADGKIWSPIDNKTANISLVGPEKLPYSQGISIGFGLNGSVDISLNLAPVYEEAIRIIEETNYIRLGNTLAVRWGYNDGQPAHVSDWFYGFMQLPEVNFGDEITLAIKATGYGLCLDQTESVRAWSKVGSPRSLKSIFNEIAKRYGLVVKGWDDLDAAQARYFEYEHDNFIQHGLTDLQFMDRMGEQCPNPVYMIIRDKNILLTSNSEKDVNPAAEFHYYGKMDPAKNIFPMTGFSPEDMGPLFLPHRSYSAIAYGPNSDPVGEVEKIDSVGNKDDTDDEASGTELHISGDFSLNTFGTDQPADPDTGVKPDVETNRLIEASKFLPVPMSGDVQRDQVKELLDSKRQGDAKDYGLKVSFDTIGIPTLIPNQIVRLRGVTKYFSTDYKIAYLNIEVGEGGADMNVKCISSGISGEMAAYAKKVVTYAQGETKDDDGTGTVEADPNAGE